MAGFVSPERIIRSLPFSVPDQMRVLCGVRVLHFSYSQSTLYTFEKANDSPYTMVPQLIIADELRPLIRKISLKKLRALIEPELEKIMQDPFGSTSIDPNKEFELFQHLRTVNRLSSAISEVTGQLVCVKGTGWPGALSDDVLNHEDLQDQFHLMRALELKSPKLDYWCRYQHLQRCPIRFAKAFAAVTLPIEQSSVSRRQQWLFMELLDKYVSIARDVINGSDFYDREKHPWLARFAGSSDSDKNPGSFLELSITLAGLGFAHTDLMGRNIMYRPDQEPEDREYVIIDPQ